MDREPLAVIFDQEKELVWERRFVFLIFCHLRKFGFLQNANLSKKFWQVLTVYMANVVRGMVALWLVHSATDLAGWVLSPAWGHCFVFLGKTLNSHSASLHPGV